MEQEKILLHGITKFPSRNDRIMNIPLYLFTHRILFQPGLVNETFDLCLLLWLPIMLRNRHWGENVILEFRLTVVILIF